MSSNDCRLSFSWPHPGESVQLAGSFNSWQPQPMSRDDDGVWRLELTAVEAGEHQFKFVVDGNWVHDGDQPNVQNEMGSCNNVVTAAPEAEGKVTEEPTQETNGGGVPEAMTSSVTSQASASSLPASASPPPKPTIEVERKFSVPANYKTLLEERGFELVKEFKETLSDDYFDSAEYDLMQADHWLRRRNGDWELKYPLVAPNGESSKEGGGVSSSPSKTTTTLYHETSNSEDIQSKLNAVRPGVGEDWRESRLTCYAHLETERWCYSRAEGAGVTVVVDVTDWGYRVGEIEMVVESKAEVPAAVERIEEIAKELDFVSLNFAKSFSFLLEE